MRCEIARALKRDDDLQVEQLVSGAILGSELGCERATRGSGANVGGGDDRHGVALGHGAACARDVHVTHVERAADSKIGVFASVVAVLVDDGKAGKLAGAVIRGSRNVLGANALGRDREVRALHRGWGRSRARARAL